MDQDQAAAATLITPPAEFSEDGRFDDQEPMVFDFDGPQTNQEFHSQAIQETSSFNAISQSGSSLKNASSEERITFNFGPQPIEAPEAEFIASFANGAKKNQMPLGIRELAASINNRRRAATNRDFRGGASAYIDEDESGTYDPVEACRTPPSPSRPAKRIRTSTSVDEDGNPKPRRLAKQIGFRYSLVVKLPLTSEKGLAYLRSIPAGVSVPAGLCGEFDSQPSFRDGELDSDDSGEFDRSKRKRAVKAPRRLGASESRSDGLTIKDLTSGHPQRRGCKCCFEQDNDGCSLIEHPDEYPCEACDDAGIDCVLIIPPPFKKSCLRCKEKRRNCSYALDGGKGVNTCDACDEASITCCAEPLTDRNMIRRYANLPTRARSNSTPTAVAKAPIRERMYVACNQCRSTGKRCNNKGKGEQAPCSNCHKANETCKFVYEKTRAPTLADSSLINKKRSSNHITHSSASTPNRDRRGTPHSPNTLTATLYSEIGLKNSRSKTEKLIAKGKLHSPNHPLHTSHFGPRRKSSSRFHQSSPKLIGRTLGLSHITITTSFCHPITFNYVPDPLLLNPCSWCDNPFFGLWGLGSKDGPRKVEGYYQPSGQGFEEIYGGFSDLGYARSVMCITCTYSRVRIAQCPSHRLRTLDPNLGEIDIRVVDDEMWERAVDAMENGDEVGSTLVRDAKWCSVCPSPAALKCCSAQLFDENGEPVIQAPHAHTNLNSISPSSPSFDHANSNGCGLLLCEDCASLLNKLIKGGARTGTKQLDSIVREVKRNKWRYTDGVRADAEFLTGDGELLRRVRQGMGASVGRKDGKGGVGIERVEGEGGWIGAGGAGGNNMSARVEKGVDRIGKGKARFDLTDDEKPSLHFQSRNKAISRPDSSLGIGFAGKGKVKGSMVPTSSGSGHRNAVQRSFSDNSQHSTNNLRPRSSITSNSASSSFTDTGTASTSQFRQQPNDRRSSQLSHMATSQIGRDSASVGDSRGIKRERESDGGEVAMDRRENGVGRRRGSMFGGYLKAEKEDVERAFGGGMGIIDLIHD